MNPRNERNALLAGCLMVVSAMLACGGGSDGGSKTSGTCLTFAAAASPAPGMVVMREGSASTCDRAAIDLVATDVADVFGASFTVSFDPDLVDYDGYSVSGSALTSDGAQVEVLATPGHGQLVFGISRFLTPDGIDVSGTAPLVRLYFRNLDRTGSGALALPTGSLDDDSTPPQEIPGVTWHAGTIAIR